MGSALMWCAFTSASEVGLAVAEDRGERVDQVRVPCRQSRGLGELFPGTGQLHGLARHIEVVRPCKW